jgi:hypothetical protein
MNTAGFASWGCAFALVFASVAGGCGGAVAPAIGDAGAGGSSGGSSGAGSSSGDVSASSSGVTSSSSGAGSSSGISGSSRIAVEQCFGGTLCNGGASTFAVFATFTQAPSQDFGCTVTSSGACGLHQCATGTAGTFSSAGTLNISGGSLTTPLQVAPASDFSYDFAGTTKYFAAGQPVTVYASGATVPAFGPVTLLEPSTVSLIAPTTTTITSQSDLQVRWSGGTAGDVFVIEGYNDTQQAYFLCQWDASVGSGGVPQAIVAGVGSGSGELFYGQYAEKAITAGEYAISDSAFAYAGSSATFQ